MGGAGTVEILLVDDEPRNLDVLESILADPAYRLLRAEDADRALRLLLDHDVAAIVLDIKMPGVSGFDLAKMIKNTRRFRETPIVFLTAYMIDDEHVMAGYGAGGVDYLTKPVNPQILRHKVAVFAELYRKTRELADLNASLEERVRERTADLERSEAALRAGAKQKDEFLAVLAHELRNPLAPLRMGLDLLLRRLSGPQGASVARTLSAMNRQLDHMVRLIDDLLDISRISRGLLELKKETVAVDVVVQATVDGLRHLFEQRGQKLSVELADGIEAEADPTRLAQIVTNVLHNATKFTPEGGTVRIELARQRDRALIRMIDSGAGIPADQLERVFDMFARLDRPSASGESGLGIGLALARRLTEMHGGTLTATSSGEGQGTTFTISLPALPVAEVAARDAGGAGNGAVAVAGVAPLTIVLIEDNQDVADTLMDWLQEMGHDVSVAHTGQSGLDLVQQAQPELVLCDLGLPEMDGLDVCRSIRALPGASQPVMVALTGWGRDDDRRRTREAGFDHHLVKPVAPGALVDLLRALRD
jgi:signal transduction histidine kinase